MITIPHAVADHDLVGEGLYRHHREGDNSAVGGVNCATNNSLSSMTDHLGRRPIYVAEPSRQCFHDLPNSSVSAVSRIGDRYRELLTLGHRVRRQLPANTARRRSIGRWIVATGVVMSGGMVVPPSTVMVSSPPAPEKV